VKSVVKFYLCALCVLCGLKTSAANADIKADMDTLANQAAAIVDTFMQKSVELRLGYEYRQGFGSDAQAQLLHDLVQKANAQLDEIILAQEKLKKQIENYNGDDWDARYGDSGIWRMAVEDICATKILKCRLEYCRAIASLPYQQGGIIRGGLAMLGGVADVGQVLLVKADMYALLGKTDESSKELAGELYRKIMALETPRSAMYYAAAIGLQKLDPPQSLAVLDELAAQLDRSESKDNFELTMSLAFLQRRLGSTTILQKATKHWPQTKAFVGDLILSDLTAKIPPQVSKLSVFEADCAVTAALQKDVPKYYDVLEAMAQIPRLQTPHLLAAAAVANIQKSPKRAIELFVKASLLPREPNDGGEPPVSMAKQGAKIALNYFKGDPNRCAIAKRAVENYFSLAGNAADGQIEYLYCDVLYNCGDKTAAEKLLQKIAAGNNSEFARRAKADLSALAISKSQALLQNKQLIEAAKILVAADVNVCDGYAHATTLLAQYVDKIDEYADSNSTIDTFSEVGRRTLDCADNQNRPYAAVLYAQAAIFAAQGQKEKFDSIERLLNSVSENTMEVLIVRARLSAAQGKYTDAAKQWGAICGILKGQPDEPPQHSYQWWRAKYFELENSLKTANASHSDIAHSVEVLQSSFSQIPAFWDKRLKSLIQLQ
jgi:hypothetical protein